MATLYTTHIRHVLPAAPRRLPDVREEPVGTFLGIVPPDAPVGSFGNVPHLRRQGAGTFVLIAFGDGVVAMAVAALNQSGRGTEIFAASGDWLIIGWGWGFAVAFGVYVAGGISGAHINPAVTLAFAARRGFPWRKVPGYIAAQMLGAFLGALLVYIVYKAAIDSFERANHITRGGASSVPTFSI